MRILGVARMLMEGRQWYLVLERLRGIADHTV